MNKDLLVVFGDQIKDLGDGRYGGYLVRYGSPDDTDLERDFFTSDTYFGPHKQFDIHYDHGMDSKVGSRPVGRGEVKYDDVGAWLEFQLERRDAYEKAIEDMIAEGKLGLSSGAVGHLVEREQVGKSYWIKSWPIGEASVTPTPAEYRNMVSRIKSLVELMPESVEPIQETVEDPVTEALEVKVEFVAEETMSDEKKEVVQETTDTGAPQFTMDDVKSELKAMFDDFRDSMKEDVKADYKVVDAPNVNTKVGHNDTHNKAWLHYVRTGDASRLKSIKAAMQEGTDSEGGYVVPNDFYARIVEKRDELSFARAAGARVIRTTLSTVDIPTEANSSSFSFIAEEGAYGQSEPTLGQVQVTVYKAGFLVKISEELLADQAANLDGFLTQHIGFQLGLHENLYVLSGTGSSQPQGVLVGGTVNNDHFTSATAITAAQMVSLRHKLAKPYRAGASWVMDDATEGYIRGLTGNPFSFMVTPQGNSNSAAFSNELLGHPVYTSASMPDIGSGLNSVVFGNWNYYALVEREGMSIQRNPYLYQANGQVGLFVKVRWGGAVIHAEAFQIANHAT